MIDTSILEEQITRFEQIIEDREKKMKFLKAQNKEDSKILKTMKEGFENLKKLKE